MENCETRQRLIDATLDLIWKSNYNSAGIAKICEQAETTKGSFYHFFKSKCDLAIAALETHWVDTKAALDSSFDPSLGPRDQIIAFSERTISSQTAHHQLNGSVYGCPFFATGMERSTLEDSVVKRVDAIVERETAYFIRLAKEIGEPHFPNAESARDGGHALFAYFQGILTTARVCNDIEIIQRNLQPGLLRLAGL